MSLRHFRNKKDPLASSTVHNYDEASNSFWTGSDPVNLRSGSRASMIRRGDPTGPRRQLTVCVVGVSGDESIRGRQGGPGKSALCNRMVRPHPDEYSEDHLWTLSSTDFSSPIINNEHWLYWGVVGKTSTMTNQFTNPPPSKTFDSFKSGTLDSVASSLASSINHSSPQPNTSSFLPSYTPSTHIALDALLEQVDVHVVEQTVFVHDQTCRPFLENSRKNTSKKSAKCYTDRCAEQVVRSNDKKLAYLCKPQLGLETEFPQTYMPSQQNLSSSFDTPIFEADRDRGCLEVDAFICVYDVSARPANLTTAYQTGLQEKQHEFLLKILRNLVKNSKKPVILATTKNDSCDFDSIARFEKFVSGNKWLKNLKIPIIETSANAGVNVAALLHMALSMVAANSRTRPSGVKFLKFADAASLQSKDEHVTREAFQDLLKSLTTPPKHSCRSDEGVRYPSDLSWSKLCRQCRYEPALVRMLGAVGMRRTNRIFAQHIKTVKEEFLEHLEWHLIYAFGEILTVDVFPCIDTCELRPYLNELSLRDFVTDRLMNLGPVFEDSFTILGDGVSWKTIPDYTEHPCSHLHKLLPFDILILDESGRCKAETQFRSSLVEYLATKDQQHHILKLQALLRNASIVKRNDSLFSHDIPPVGPITPGQALDEGLTAWLVDHDCWLSLPDETRTQIYVDFQRWLREQSLLDFHELLDENLTSITADFRSKSPKSAFDAIKRKLEVDDRFSRFDVPTRQLLILQHVQFLFGKSSSSEASKQVESVSPACRFSTDCFDVSISDFLGRQKTAFEQGPTSISCRHESSTIAIGYPGINSTLRSQFETMSKNSEKRVDFVHLENVDIESFPRILRNQASSLPTLDAFVVLYSNFDELFKFSAKMCQILANHSSATIPPMDASMSSTDRSIGNEPIFLAFLATESNKGDVFALKTEGRRLVEHLELSGFLDLPPDITPRKSSYTSTTGSSSLEKLISTVVNAIPASSRLLASPWKQPSDLTATFVFTCGDEFNLLTTLAPFVHHSCCHIEEMGQDEQRLCIRQHLDLGCHTKKIVRTTFISHHDFMATFNPDRSMPSDAYVLTCWPHRSASLEILNAKLERLCTATKLKVAKILVLVISDLPMSPRPSATSPSAISTAETMSNFGDDVQDLSDKRIAQIKILTKKFGVDMQVIGCESDSNENPYIGFLKKVSKVAEKNDDIKRDRVNKISERWAQALSARPTTNSNNNVLSPSLSQRGQTPTNSSSGCSSACSSGTKRPDEDDDDETQTIESPPAAQFDRNDAAAPSANRDGAFWRRIMRRTAAAKNKQHRSKSQHHRQGTKPELPRKSSAPWEESALSSPISPIKPDSNRAHSLVPGLFYALTSSSSANNDLGCGRKNKTQIANNKSSGSLKASNQDLQRSGLLKVVGQLFAAIETIEPKIEGMYRHSTDVKKQNQLLAWLLDPSKEKEVAPVSLEIENVRDLHLLCCTTKALFRNHINLIPDDVRRLLCSEKYSQNLEAINALLEKKLSPTAQNCLKSLLAHLHRLLPFESKTLMSAYNLSVVWAPNILVPTNAKSVEILQFHAKAHNQFNFFLANFDTILPNISVELPVANSSVESGAFFSEDELDSVLSASFSPSQENHQQNMMAAGITIKVE